MHLKYKYITPDKWTEIKTLLSNDGIGGIHIWSGDGSSSIAMLNEIQKRSRIPIIIDADIERGLGQRFISGTDFPPLMAITATGNPDNAYEVGKIVARESIKGFKKDVLTKIHGGGAVSYTHLTLPTKA